MLTGLQTPVLSCPKDTQGRAETLPGHLEERLTNEEERSGESAVSLNNRAVEHDDQGPDDVGEQSDGALEADGIEGGEEEMDGEGDGEMKGAEDQTNTEEVSYGEARVSEETKIVRARSAWMLFLADNRDKVRTDLVSRLIPT